MHLKALLASVSAYTHPSRYVSLLRKRTPSLPEMNFWVFWTGLYKAPLIIIFFFLIIVVTMETLNVPFSQITFSSSFPENFIKIFHLKIYIYIYIKSVIAKPGGTGRAPNQRWLFSWLLTNPVKSTCCAALVWHGGLEFCACRWGFSLILITRIKLCIRVMRFLYFFFLFLLSLCSTMG